jgi:uncharacterized membrane protein YbhN (UPF0104 family)
VTAFLDAVGAFAGHLGAARWDLLGVAVVLHVAKTAAVSRAWRNVIAAAYPGARVRWSDLFGAYVAGVGINAVVPARGGDVGKLYIAHERVRGSTYTTLASTIVALTTFDGVVATALLLWAIAIGALPSLDVLPNLPPFDFTWVFEHPRLALALAAALVAAAVVGATWAARRVVAFKRRVAQGFAVMRSPRRYVCGVVSWQAVDWGLRLATIYFALRAFGIPASFQTALLVQVTQSLSTVFPISPSGVGTEQALLLFVLAGTAPGSALLAFSLGMNVTIMAVNATLGLAAIALMLRTLRWRRLVEPEVKAQTRLVEETPSVSL